MFGMPSVHISTPNFMFKMQEVFTDLFNQAGLQLITDVAAKSAPFGLSITAEDKKEWSDEPAIDKLINVIMKAGIGEERPHCMRLLAVLPRTCNIVAAVAYSYRPASIEQSLQLSSVAEWEVMIWARELEACTFKGTILNHEMFNKAAQHLGMLCANIQRMFKLDPIQPRDGGLLDGLGTYSSGVPCPLEEQAKPAFSSPYWPSA
jgi:hypothetical protein